MNKLGGRVRFFRCKMGLSQKQLAEKVKLSQSTIAQIETGGNEPSLQTLRKISKTLSVAMKDFFVETLQVEI